MTRARAGPATDDVRGAVRRRLRRRPRRRRARACSASTSTGAPSTTTSSSATSAPTCPAGRSERRFYFDPAWNPGRQVLIHPCPDSTFRIDWQVPAGLRPRRGGAHPGALDARIRQIIGDRAYELVWSSVYRFHSRVRRPDAGRAGAARRRLRPPGLAVRRPRAQLRRAGRRERRVEDRLRRCTAGRREALLESYHAERHAAALENLEVTTATMDFLVPRTTRPAPAARRACSSGAGTDPAARAQVDSGRLAEPFWYVDSPLTTPDPTPAVRRAAAARRTCPPPAPGILRARRAGRVAGGATRLRQIARDGFLLLAADGVDADAVRRGRRRRRPAPVRVLAPRRHRPDRRARRRPRGPPRRGVDRPAGRARRRGARRSASPTPSGMALRPCAAARRRRPRGETTMAYYRHAR